MPVIEQKTTNKNKVDFDLNRLDKSKTTIFSKYPKLKKGAAFFGLSKPTKRRPNICDSFSAMMPLFLREKSSLKGRWRLETVQNLRSSSSNPVSCSETSIKIYGSKEEIRARKSPETVDAPGFAPDASIPVTLYGAAGRIRTADLILTKDALYLLSYSSKWRPGRGSNPRPPA